MRYRNKPTGIVRDMVERPATIPYCNPGEMEYTYTDRARGYMVIVSEAILAEQWEPMPATTART